MDEVHAAHTVSVKIAMYSSDFEKVLIMQYPEVYGLPGGHLEENELPDEALIRELDEELGATLTDFNRTSFFLRSGRGSSVILGYTAIVPADFEFNPPNPEKEKGIWVTKQDFENIENISSEYKKLVFENWPTK